MRAGLTNPHYRGFPFPRLLFDSTHTARRKHATPSPSACRTRGRSWRTPLTAHYRPILDTVHSPGAQSLRRYMLMMRLRSGGQCVEAEGEPVGSVWKAARHPRQGSGACGCVLRAGLFAVWCCCPVGHGVACLVPEVGLVKPPEAGPFECLASPGSGERRRTLRRPILW